MTTAGLECRTRPLAKCLPMSQEKEPSSRRALDSEWAKRLRFDLVLMFLVTIFVVVVTRINHPPPPPLSPYDEITQKLETEQRKFDRMRTSRIAASGTPTDAEEKQRDLVLRLVKERDALAEPLGHPVKPPNAPSRE